MDRLLNNKKDIVLLKIIFGIVLFNRKISGYIVLINRKKYGQIVK